MRAAVMSASSSLRTGLVVPGAVQHEAVRRRPGTSALRAREVPGLATLARNGKSWIDLGRTAAPRLLAGPLRHARGEGRGGPQVVPNLRSLIASKSWTPPPTRLVV